MFRVLLIAGLCLFIGACGADSRGLGGEAPLPVTTADESLPADGSPGGTGLPLPSALRAGSGTITASLSGSQANATSANAQVHGTRLELECTQPGDRMAWAIYSFAGMAEAMQMSVETYAAENVTMWIGLADFAADHWEFERWSSGTSSAYFQAEPAPEHLSSSGIRSIAIVITEGELLLERVSCHYEDGGPVAVITGGPFHGPAPYQPTLSGSASFDPDGFIAKYEWDFEADGVYDFESPEPEVIMAFFLGEHTLRLRVTDNDGKQAIAERDIHAHAPAASLPVPILKVPEDDELWGYFPLLDGSESYDPDGSIVKYEWDLTGVPGDYEFDSEGSPYAEAAYYDAGSFTVGLRVTDDEGQQSSIMVPVVYHGWISEPIIPLHGSESSISGAVIGGRPAVACSDPESGYLSFAVCEQPSGQGNWDSVVLDEDAGAGTQVSLVNHLANASLAWYDPAAQELWYGHCSGVCTDKGDWDFVTIDSNDDVGAWPSLAVVNGRPAVSCYNATEGDLVFASSSTEAGLLAADWSIAEVDSGGDCGQYSSLALIDGAPAISYYDATGRTLRYAYSTDNGGYIWIKLTANNAAPLGEFSSLVEFEGHPAIASYAEDEHTPSYAVGADLGQSQADWGGVNIDGFGEAGRYSDIEVIGGELYIAYYDEAGKLRIAQSASGGLQASDWDVSIIYLTEKVGPGIDLIDLEGRPGIFFHAPEEEYLLLAQRI